MSAFIPSWMLRMCFSNGRVCMCVCHNPPLCIKVLLYPLVSGPFGTANAPCDVFLFLRIGMLWTICPNILSCSILNARQMARPSRASLSSKWNTRMQFRWGSFSGCVATGLSTAGVDNSESNGPIAVSYSGYKTVMPKT